MSSNTTQCEKCQTPISHDGKLCDECKKEAQLERSRLYHKARRARRVKEGRCIQCGEKKTLPENIDEYIAETTCPELVSLIDKENMMDSKFCYKCYIPPKYETYKKRLEREANNPRAKLTEEERKEIRKQQVREAGRQRRARLLAENPNLCGHCLKRDKAEDKKWCEECLERANKINRSRIEERRKKKACITCGAPTKGKQLCQKCKPLQQKYSKKWFDKAKVEREEEGLCVRCGVNKPEEGRKSCDECLQKIRDYMQEKNGTRMCKQCNKNELGYRERVCPDCKKINRAKKEKARTARRKKARAEEKIQKNTPPKPQPKPVTMPELVVQTKTAPTVTVIMNGAADDEF